MYYLLPSTCAPLQQFGRLDICASFLLSFKEAGQWQGNGSQYKIALVVFLRRREMGAHHSFKQPSTKRRQDQIEVYFKIVILMFPQKMLYFHQDMVSFLSFFKIKCIHEISVLTEEEVKQLYRWDSFSTEISEIMLCCLCVMK